MPISKINSKALVDCSVAAVDIADNSITAAKLAGSIDNAKLANSSVTINSTSVSLGASANINALDWQSVIVADGSTGTTGVAGRGYFINTTSAAHTFTLPVSATRGDTIAIKDYAGTFATFNLTINRNGHKIQGVENNSLISTNRASVVLVYADVTRGWEFTTESNVGDLGSPLFIAATGGTILTSGNYKTHVFTNDGSFVVSQIGNAPTQPTGGPAIVDYLVVAGGGNNGAGGFRVSNCATRSGLPAPGMSPLVTTTGITLTATTYPITVGAGGATSPAYTPGSPSIFSTITSAGGGITVCNSPSPNYSGGSGGGGGAYVSWSPQVVPGASGNTPPTSPSQGNRGGNLSGLVNSSGSSIAFAGGGGAGAAGTDVTVGPTTFSPGGNGGIGSFISDSFLGPTAPSYGTPGPAPAVRYFAGGGAGFSQRCASPVGSGEGGAGGGGGITAGSAGATNTGGGGGSNYLDSGNGGKGIVVIRYKFQ